MRRYGATGGGRERPRSGRGGVKERRKTPDPDPTHPESPEPLGGDSGRSDGPGPSKPSNPAPSSETEAVGSPQIDEDAAPRGTGTPGFVVCGCQRAGCGAVFDGAPGSSVCPACAAGPPGAGAAWTHAPDPDGGTRCGQGSEGRDVLPIRRAGEATCPNCRAAIDPDGTAPATRQPEPDTSESGPGPEELERVRAALADSFHSAIEGRALLPEDPANPSGPWVPAPRLDPLTVWQVARDFVADAGLPDSILPPQPVSAETRRDSLLPVVQSVSEPPEREAARSWRGGAVLPSTCGSLSGRCCGLRTMPAQPVDGWR